MTLRALPKVGLITVYCGPMFSGKSEALLSDLKLRRDHGRQRFQLFNPRTNTRDGGVCRSRKGLEEPSISFETIAELRDLIDPEVNAIAFDEVQFAPREIVRLIVALRDRGQDVVVAGLDYDFYGLPFPVVAEIVNTTSDVHRRHAWCTQCGDRAQWSQLLTQLPSDGGNIVIGDNEYEARCFSHFTPKP